MAAVGVCVAGPGLRLTNGVSHYTNGLLHQLHREGGASTIQLRKVAPARNAPADLRLSGATGGLTLPDGMPAMVDVDFASPTVGTRARRFFEQHRPGALVLVWWSGATAHTYARLAQAADKLDIPVIVDFHERADRGALTGPVRRALVSTITKPLFEVASGGITHSSFAKGLVVGRFGLAADDVIVAEDLPEAPALPMDVFPVVAVVGAAEAVTLVRAFDSMAEEVISGYRLVLATHDLAAVRAIAARSRHAMQIDVVALPTTAEMVQAQVEDAGLVVLPNLDAAGARELFASEAIRQGRLLVDPAERIRTSYSGSVHVRPGHVADLAVAFERARDLAACRFAPAHDWDAVLGAYRQLLERVEARQVVAGVA